MFHLLLVAPMLLLSTIYFIFLFGILLILLGSIFLIVFLIRQRKSIQNKTKKRFGFLIAATVLLSIGIMCTVPHLLVLLAFSLL